ncbi:hypothetical protein KA005_77325 [bacterium]|nr:hypothetical protein [bacterium]
MTDIEIADEQPILAFLCNPVARAKAVKTISALAMTIEDRVARVEVLGLPIKKDSSVAKNTLVAATTDDKTVFTINMKTGESYYE